MSTSAENERWLSKSWVQIGVAIVVAVAGYFVGYSKGADAPPDTLGDEVRRIATEKEAETALVTGKRSGVNFIHVLSGKTIPPCDKRSPGQEQCKFSVRKEADGKYVLLGSDQRPVPEDKIYSVTHIIDHEGGHCTTGSSSSGGHTTTNSNCCHSPACY